MKVTVLVPCWNEADGLESLFTRLRVLMKGRERDWEIVAINDGSSDQTGALLDAEAHRLPWLRVLHHSRNRGLGGALRTGFGSAKGEIVCTIDSDCTYPPERLPEFVARIERGADLVTASPWHPENASVQASRIRVGLSRGASRVYRAMVGARVHTYTCLFRAYRRSRLNHIRFDSNGFAAVTEIMVKALLTGCRVEEVPMPLEARQFGVSKMSIHKAMVGHLNLMKSTARWVAAHRLGAN
jgi:dolichol-phosphate mannosyltransferase